MPVIDSFGESPALLYHGIPVFSRKNAGKNRNDRRSGYFLSNEGEIKKTNLKCVIYCTKEFLFLADSFYECKSWGFIRGRTPLLPPFNLSEQVKGRRGSCLCKNRVTYFLYQPHLIFSFQINDKPAQPQNFCVEILHTILPHVKFLHRQR